MSANTTISEIRIMLFPKDFALTRAFYQGTVQWPISHEWDYDNSKGVMFDTGAGTIELLWPGENSGNYNLSFRVVDVWSLWKNLSERATVLFALRENPWGDDSFCILDPDGNKLTFFTDRPRP